MKIINVAHAQVIENSPRLAEIGLNILQFLLQIFGIIAIISLVISGILYLTSGGSEDRISFAKKTFTYSVIGIIVALMSLIIIKQISKILV